jgi:hypothetical protein
MTRQGRSKLLTMCTACDREVGVWFTPFNNDRNSYKTSAHLVNGKRCPGALLSIHPNNAWPNPEAA